ncbi:halocarboxylic acid dehydrogenase DehI family protein [Neptunomonas sp. XY-337]|uniref:halocarboxylic acid dehydrogenase DehI family protein n=1 Tax=Neptunomonas sp. XY-337 TaxID=2561897 RepID=UPI0010A9CC0E|nr:halocarboxylic acid dehydrogenase DehI family protein [Neptunomonas sp. XY-337]
MRQMKPLPRLKPTPLPSLNIVPEVEARGDLKRVYEDTKQILGVPWMGVVTMAFASYHNFYEVLWQGIRETCGTEQFSQACIKLQEYVELRAKEIPTTDLSDTLIQQGYSERELGQIMATIEVFAKGNMPYLLIASLTRAILEGHELPVSPTSAAPMPKPTEKLAPLLLIEEHHATPDLQQVYADIKSTLDLPFVNTDYRALARWPSYFTAAWKDLQPHIDTPRYEQILTDIHSKALDIISELPVHEGLNTQTLINAAARDTNRESVLRVVELFQYLLPGLITNVAVFKHQLANIHR